MAPRFPNWTVIWQVVSVCKSAKSGAEPTTDRLTECRVVVVFMCLRRRGLGMVGGLTETAEFVLELMLILYPLMSLSFCVTVL